MWLDEVLSSSFLVGTSQLLIFPDFFVFAIGSSKGNWEPAMTTDTTNPSYWLNWRFLLCSIWLLVSMIFAIFLISKYEKPQNFNNEDRENEEEPAGLVYEDELYKPCVEGVHPVWLLVYRIVAFFVLSILLCVNVAVDGGGIFYFYTQWTFTMITIYFGMGSLLSLYGCYQHHINKVSNRITNDCVDTEQGTDVSTTRIEFSEPSKFKNIGPDDGNSIRKIAGFWGYFFQIIFQTNAGAVLLTDCVFWFFIVPFLAMKDYNLNILKIQMHTVNAIFLLGDTALNCLRFPWFRIAYFFLWTSGFVIFQWILHACTSIWWPYPFLDLSSSKAPLWYLVVAIMHIPCYSFFVLVIKLKKYLLLKWFPNTYQCAI